ncbi:MAG: hypothetical protein IKD66_10950 [Solobacterium sp.]|jgi:hypothetical protein|nr:hypothetical protein [Solobacterium sp.]HCJ76758.1 hypothetical protein [Roseburia sp.]
MTRERRMKMEIKYLLTIKEAASYFGIGEKKLRAMSEYCEGLFITNGTKLLVNRKKMEEYLDNCTTV